MDYEDCRSPSSEPAAVAAVVDDDDDDVGLPYHLQDRIQLTDVTNQLPQQLSHREVAHHLTGLNFPTLNSDGSVHDLTAHSSRVYDITPPAALSSLGQKAKMEQKMQVSESSGSLADGQYDMIDDLSEISDDNETASLASNDQDNTMDTSSDLDEEEQSDLIFPQSPNGDRQYDVLNDSFITLPLRHPVDTEIDSDNERQQSMKMENDLIDSYMSEDLETPRQSTLAPNLAKSMFGARAATHKFLGKQSSNFGADDEDIHKILFLSNRNLEQSELDQACGKVATSLQYRATSGQYSHRIVRLPVAPAGSDLPSWSFVDDSGDVVATVQHCIGARRLGHDVYELHVLNSDKECYSDFTVGSNKGSSLTKPDIAVFYLPGNVDDAAWMISAHEAVQNLNIPVLFICEGSSKDLQLRNFPDLEMSGREGRTKGIFSRDLLARMDHSALASYIGKISEVETKKHKVEGRDLGKSKPFSGFAWWQIMAATLIAILPYALLFALRFTAQNPGVQLLVRRESLGAAFTEIAGPSSFEHSIDIEHLLPQPSADCVTTDIFGRHTMSPACKQEVRYQGILPNHMIVALPGYGRFPRQLSTEVVRSDGRRMEFNQTELIEGVYDINFAPHEAHGIITVSMSSEKPQLNLSASHNYGNRMLQRKTYENAGTDVSNAVGKEVTIMRNAARSLSDKVTTEVKVGYQATRSVTRELALAMSRDLQVFAGTAASMLGSVTKARNRTATALSKDLSRVQGELVKYSKELSTTVTSAVQHAKEETKSVLRHPLAVSRERLLSLGHALGRKQRRAVHIGTPKQRSLLERIRGQHSQGEDVVPEHQQITSLSTVLEPDSFIATPPPELATHAARHAQRQVTRAMQQLERSGRYIKRKEQELRDFGDRVTRKELRQLKKDFKQREKALKKMVDDLKYDGA